MAERELEMIQGFLPHLSERCPIGREKNTSKVPRKEYNIPMVTREMPSDLK